MLIALHSFVGRRYSEESEAENLNGCPIIQPDWFRWINLQPVGHKRAICLGYYNLQIPVLCEDRAQSFRVEMVRVIVRRSGDAYEGKSRGINRQLRHANVGLIGLAVISRQRIGEIGIEQHVDPLPLKEKAALSQPPQTKITIVSIRSMNVCEEIVVGLDGLNHESPSSLRTVSTPLTMFASFWLAAQRAV